jgi:hypothetical protein
MCPSTAEPFVNIPAINEAAILQGELVGIQDPDALLHGSLSLVAECANRAWGGSGGALQQLPLVSPNFSIVIDRDQCPLEGIRLSLFHRDHVAPIIRRLVWIGKEAPRHDKTCKCSASFDHDSRA